MILLAALSACEVPLTDATGHSGTPADPPLRESEQSGKTDANGVFTVEVEVGEGDTSFQVTATTPGENFTSLESLRDPDGKKVIDWEAAIADPRQLTGAVFPQRGTTAFNWPIQEKQAPLAPGVWKVSWMVTTPSFFVLPRTKIDTITAIKRDDDLSAGVVHARVLWARGVDDPKVVNAVEEAVEHWREIWGSAGITLVERYDTTDLDPNLAFYDEGSKDAEEVSADKDPGELQLIVGETVDHDGYIYGVSSGIPGTIEITDSSYVVMSWLTHAGRDGKFDTDEIKLMGETMAHECGHFIGLFHPVETGYSRWDDLKDTAECSSWPTCSDTLGRNLMFPFSICDASGCVNQIQVTNDQQGVMQLQPSAL